MPEDELSVVAKELQTPYELAKKGAATGQPSVALFTAGGLASPADAAMMMRRADGVLVGSEIDKASRGQGGHQRRRNTAAPATRRARSATRRRLSPRWVGRPAGQTGARASGTCRLRRGISATAFSLRWDDGASRREAPFRPAFDSRLGVRPGPQKRMECYKFSIDYSDVMNFT